VPVRAHNCISHVDITSDFQKDTASFSMT